MTRVGIRYSTYQSREPYDDGWDRGDTDGSVDSVYIVKSEYGQSYNDFETELEPPFYVVYAEYVTGNTFGSDFACTIVGVEKDAEKANDLVKEAEKFRGFGSLSNGHYVEWNGYFERLESIRVECLYG